MNPATNKKGGSKILSIYWFVIILIVAGGIFGMVYSFYNHPYDVREVEANLLINHVADCFSSGGELVGGWQQISQDNLLEKCNINLNVEDIYGWKNDQYYLEINFLDFTQCL